MLGNTVSFRLQIKFKPNCRDLSNKEQLRNGQTQNPNKFVNNAIQNMGHQKCVISLLAFELGTHDTVL